MARAPEGFRLRRDRRTGIVYVRFTFAGKRYNLATGARDSTQAAQRAARIYAEVVSGRLRPRSVRSELAVAARPPVDAVAAEWLADIEAGYEGVTMEVWMVYARHFARFFETCDRLTHDAVEDYKLFRLRLVLRETLIKELTALRSLAAWCRRKGYIDEVPVISNPPPRKRGTPDSTRRHKRRPVKLDQQQVAAIIAALPERSTGSVQQGRFVVRGRFIVAYETGLRPSTIDKLCAPGDYIRGSRTLIIRDDVDKAQFGRELPLSEAARAALDEVTPDAGLIFGRHDYRKYLKRAARDAGLPEHEAKRVSPYDFRHARGTHLCEHTNNLAGVAYLLGHKHITTTNRYVHPAKRAAEAVLGAARQGLAPQTGRTDDERAADGEEREECGTPKTGGDSAASDCAKRGA